MKTAIVDGLERFGGPFRPDGVECDLCHRVENTDRFKYKTPCYANLEFDLFKRGWFVHNGKHYCPECVDV